MSDNPELSEDVDLTSTEGHGLSPAARKRLAIAGCLLFLFVAGLFLAGETAVRYRERHRAEVPSSTPSAFYRHSRTGAAMVRNLDYYGWFSINEHGFRGASFPLREAPGEFRIMVVGGSTTFDTQVSADSLSWPARLEYWLRQEVVGDASSIRVINAGTPGYRVLDNLVRLETELFAFQPDLLLLYHGHNDISCALADRAGRRTRIGNRPDQASVGTPWGTWLQQNSEFYNKLVARWRAWVRRWAGGRMVAAEPPPIREADAPFLCGPPQFERHVRAFLAAAQQVGAVVAVAPVVHVSQPDVDHEPEAGLRRSWSDARPYAEPDSALKLYRDYADALARSADESGAFFIETAGFEIRGSRFYGRNDPMHFNDLGADAMGRSIARALIQADLIETSR